MCLRRPKCLQRCRLDARSRATLFISARAQGVPRRGIVRDEPLEGMRATVQRRTPRNPGARSTPRVVSSLRNEGQEEQRSIGGDAMGALEGAPEEQMMRRTVAELKQMCEVRGLKKSGRKADIVRRLIEGA